MLAPVGIIYRKVEDREPWKQPNPRLRKVKKKKKEEASPQVAPDKGDHIDLTA